MIWQILRPHYWILDRKVRATRPIVIIAPLLLVLWGGEWLYNNAVSQYLGLLNSEQAATAVATSLPIGLFLILAFSILGFGDVLHQLYQATDIELLMVAPIPKSIIFLVKLIQCSRAPLIPALSLGASLALLGLARNAPVSYFLLIVLLTLLIVIMATAVVMILAVLLARWLPAQRTRFWMPLFVALLTLLMMLGQQSATQWFLNQVKLITFFTDALFNLQKLSLLLVGLGGMTVVISLGALGIFVSYFHESWNRYRLVPTDQAAVSWVERRLKRVPGSATWLPSPMRFIWGKEWLEMRRNPRGLLNLMQPLVLVAATLILFLGAGKGADVLLPLSFYTILAFLALFLTMQPIGTALMSVAQEGRNIALFQSTPVSMKAMLQGKFWATWIPVALSWVVVLIAAGVWLHFPVWQTAVLVGTAVWGLAGASAATMAVGGLMVDFLADDLRQRTSPLVNYLVMGLNAIFVLLTIVTSIWLIVHLFPDSLAVLIIRGLADISVVGWIFSNDLRIPLSLVAGQLIFWLGLKLLWAAAARRLEGWEAG
ncbi:MAG: hypothetical protein IPM39_19825 [Chloroflexi bacterium]|nr:hypothetical protein [Chloroflexota bacterium]